MRIITSTSMKPVTAAEGADVDIVLSLIEDKENHDVRSFGATMRVSAKLAQQLEDGHKCQVELKKGGSLEKK